LPLDLDFSSLITYHECAYRYRLRHICGFQPRLATELGFGKILHHVIAELARSAQQGEPPTEERVDALLEGAFYLPFAGPIPAEKLKESMRRRLMTYASEWGDELLRTRTPEASFEVPLANARIRGRIDLILNADSGDRDCVELVDFKASANRPPSDVHSNQLRLYAAAAERVGMKPVRLLIHDLDRGERVEVSQSFTDESQFEERLRLWLTGIREGRFPPVADDSVCAKCDFEAFCRHS
jgi:DNA helicase-2/ATP-dependent DNA helicase PcrA